jgi:predicted AlkP superfamily phosphohydrolase/phosphomutase
VKISRRNLIRKGALGISSGITAPLVGVAPSSLFTGGRAPYVRNAKFGKKTVVVGMDGMDPALLRRFIDQGDMPTFKTFLEKGRFGELGTTLPPQSPVAWSSFITGVNPGGHGIFDFVHRDPIKFEPYLSTTRSTGSSSSISVGDWSVPVSSGSVDLMRKGRPFWSVLEEHGIPTTLFALPANFPVVPDGEVKALSGMGTPDLLGSYGTFTFYTETSIPDSENWSGGRVIKVRPANHVFSTTLEGPTNSFKRSGEAAALPLTIARDPWEPTVKISIGSEELLLKEGDWSEWVPLRFEFIPLFAAVGGMVRFYVKQVHPTLKVYVSPINIDPMDPTLPICSPNGYSKEVAQVAGRFYTQGFPADQKALAFGVLSDDEYFHQAKIVLEENFKILDYQLSQFDDGFFFFYFSSLDQNCHMLWRLSDPSHPMYQPNASAELKNAVRYFYRRMDDALRLVLSRVDQGTTFYLLSDHGFGTFTREFHLSRWLVNEGFTVLKDPTSKDPGDMYDQVDWSKTTAYALGINGIYLNLKGREPNGVVSPEQAQGIKDRIIQKLVTVVDPANGKEMVRNAFDGAKAYSGPHRFLAPDVVVGYHNGYRISDEAVLGKFPLDLVGDRTNKWSADHCFDPALVPGVLLSNKTNWREGQMGICDLAPSILDSFGVPVPGEMEGRAIVKA